MKKLSELENGTIVTVTAVSGGRKKEKELEELGIMPGSDLTILDSDSSGVLVDTGRRQIRLSDEDAGVIRFSPEFRRHKDPVLLGGCCAYGNTGDMIERINRMYGEGEGR